MTQQLSKYDKNNTSFSHIYHFELCIYRFLKVASVMEKNLSLFRSVCKHVDIITTIIEYLNNIGMQLMFDNKYGNVVFIIRKDKLLFMLFANFIL